ncbi:MAG TPA: response regulator [Geobacteraceae bacterium]|nr:response regulator [Geobacteraceae bacterium]
MESMSNPIPSISMLLVEDEELTRDLLADILTKKYPEIPLYAAINGRRGLELFKSHTPNIVITDINMPEMGGVQMASKIRVIKPDTKFIVLTGTIEKNDLQDSVEKGFEFDHFIVKPVIFQELFAAIEQCFGEITQYQA